MTAVAYRAGFLAADSLVCQGDKAVSWIDKVRVFQRDEGVYLAAGAGPVHEMLKFFEWVREGMISEIDFLKDAVMVLVYPDGTFMEYNDTGPSGPWHHFDSWGQHQFLSGCMEMGASAEEAVIAAARRVITCGGPVKVYQAGVGLVRVLPAPSKDVLSVATAVDDAKLASPEGDMAWQSYEEFTRPKDPAL